MCRTILLMSTKWLRLVLEKNELFPKWKTFENKKSARLIAVSQTHMYGMLSTYREQVQYIASLS
nr:MAG TPA: hypothetical protein [Caudoviricetes sp.]